MFDTVLCDTALTDTIMFDTALTDAALFHTALFDTDTAMFDTALTDTIIFDTALTVDALPGITTDEPHLKLMAARITDHALTSAALEAHGIQSLQSRIRTTDAGSLPGPCFMPSHTTLPECWSSHPNPTPTQQCTATAPSAAEIRRQYKTNFEKTKRAKILDPLAEQARLDKERLRGQERRAKAKALKES